MLHNGLYIFPLLIPLLILYSISALLHICIGYYSCRITHYFSGHVTVARIFTCLLHYYPFLIIYPILWHFCKSKLRIFLKSPVRFYFCKNVTKSVTDTGTQTKSDTKKFLAQIRPFLFILFIFVLVKSWCICQKIYTSNLLSKVNFGNYQGIWNCWKIVMGRL